MNNARTEEVLILLKRVRFITYKQLAQYFGISQKNANKHINSMCEQKLLEPVPGARPSAFRMSTKAATAANVEYMRKWRSPAAVHQYLMRNEFELTMRQRWPDFQMLTAGQVKSRGLNLAKAEWPARFTDDQGQVHLALVLIDDYMMHVDRLRHALIRKHETKNNDAYMAAFRAGKIDRIPRWDKYVSWLFVVTTFESRVDQFKSEASKLWTKTTKKIFINGKHETVNLEMPDRVNIEVQSLKPIWRIA
ncbi:MarR family transcriptional regulator [Reinekea blandensis]|uniref:Uncharacterized protein n=1 Tax=Reinekea blandensis MED297 TaxID=314283 RepID=A4BJW9_9GAMM|nr:helix-turn-helix domain-containing protein [Reinekea blandensis]EAR07570.1 hypothetical protein MED297_00075 [Reinekea sp. MED297] [Reinekea blandensis MED297]